MANGDVDNVQMRAQRSVTTRAHTNRVSHFQQHGPSCATAETDKNICTHFVVALRIPERIRREPVTLHAHTRPKHRRHAVITGTSRAWSLCRLATVVSLSQAPTHVNSPRSCQATHANKAPRSTRTDIARSGNCLAGHFMSVSQTLYPVDVTVVPL